MRIGWSLPLPGPFRVSGNVGFPRFGKSGRSAKSRPVGPGRGRSDESWAGVLIGPLVACPPAALFGALAGGLPGAIGFAVVVYLALVLLCLAFVLAVLVIGGLFATPFIVADRVTERKLERKRAQAEIDRAMAVEMGNDDEMSAIATEQMVFIIRERAMERIRRNP